MGQEEEVLSSPLTSNAALAPNNDTFLSPSPLSSLSQASNSLANSRLASNDPTPLSLKEDNQGSIALAHNPVFHARTKHIDIQHHYIRDKVATRRINLQYVPTSEMIANGMTKALTNAKFYRFVKQMRIC